jgi:hypothetical protein
MRLKRVKSPIKVDLEALVGLVDAESVLDSGARPGHVPHRYLRLRLSKRGTSISSEVSRGEKMALQRIDPESCITECT